MAREKKKAEKPKAMWLVTFSDLVTLLLTFFVLLLSMSSMDQSFITQVTVHTAELGFLTSRGAGRVNAKVKMVSEILERPWEVMEKQNRIKDLLFPDEVLPGDINRKTLDENLEILERPEGVALVLTDKLLFPLGKTELDDSAKKLLAQLIPVINYLTSPVNIAGYSDNVGGASLSNFRISEDRALAVLGFFSKFGVPRLQMSVSAYGPFSPIASNDTPEGRAKNRRVEILLRTVPRMGGYIS
ncbi:MAG: chemotaxis protein MotB [Desulfovibrionales bacterium]|jgi:chemotaxis protein MotB|nr:chemotaxis protein MotB [Desulfovibrionales bacterium]